MRLTISQCELIALIPFGIDSNIFFNVVSFPRKSRANNHAQTKNLYLSQVIRSNMYLVIRFEFSVNESTSQLTSYLSINL